MILHPKQRHQAFVRLAYGFLPMVLASNLAHYLKLGLTEAGRIIPVTLATFGYNRLNLPVAVAHPAVIAFLPLRSRTLNSVCKVRPPIREILPETHAFNSTHTQ